MRRLKPLVATLAVTGALVGGGAAIANAATSTSSTSTTPTTKASPPAHSDTAPGKAHAGAGHNCPNM